MRNNRIFSLALGILAVLAGLVALRYTAMGIEVLLSPMSGMSPIDKFLSVLGPGALTIGAFYMGFRFLCSAFAPRKST
jgi:hypothetical protein